MPKLTEISKKLAPLIETKYVIYLYTLLDEVKRDNPVHGSLLFAGVTSTENEAIEKGMQIEKVVRETCPEHFVGVAAMTTGQWDILSNKASHRRNINSMHKLEQDYEAQEEARKNMMLELEREAEQEASESSNPNTLAHHSYQSYLMIQDYMQMKHHEKELQKLSESYTRHKNAVLESLAKHPEYSQQWRDKFLSTSEKWGELDRALIYLDNEEAALGHGRL